MSDENKKVDVDEPEKVTTDDFEGHKLTEVGKVDDEQVDEKVDDDDFEAHKLVDVVVEKVTET